MKAIEIKIDLVNGCEAETVATKTVIAENKKQIDAVKTVLRIYGRVVKRYMVFFEEENAEVMVYHKPISDGDKVDLKNAVSAEDYVNATNIAILEMLIDMESGMRPEDFE